MGPSGGRIRFPLDIVSNVCAAEIGGRARLSFFAKAMKAARSVGALALGFALGLAARAARAQSRATADKSGARGVEAKPKPSEGLVTLNLEDADLTELVKAISGITGKRFVYSGKLRPIKSTVYAPDKM